MNDDTGTDMPYGPLPMGRSTSNFTDPLSLLTSVAEHSIAGNSFSVPDASKDKGNDRTTIIDDRKRQIRIENDQLIQKSQLQNALAAYLYSSNAALIKNTTTPYNPSPLPQHVSFTTTTTGTGSRSSSNQRESLSMDEDETFKDGSGDGENSPRCNTDFVIEDGDNKSSDNNNNNNNNGQERMPKRYKRSTDKKRSEKNQREKERSSRIANQISELSELLCAGGVKLAKGTKGSVLSEAAEYIRTLQNKQVQLEQQATQLANVIVPQPSTITEALDCHNNVVMTSTSSEYQLAFHSCGVGIGITSMNGSFIDCNSVFCNVSGCTRNEILERSFFNLIAKEDLARAFDEISNLLQFSPTKQESAQLDGSSSSGTCNDPMMNNNTSNRLILRTSIKRSDEYRLMIAILRDEQQSSSIPKGFCVTLLETIDYKK